MADEKKLLLESALYYLRAHLQGMAAAMSDIRSSPFSSTRNQAMENFLTYLAVAAVLTVIVVDSQHTETDKEKIRQFIANLKEEIEFDAIVGGELSGASQAMVDGLVAQLDDV